MSYVIAIVMFIVSSYVIPLRNGLHEGVDHLAHAALRVGEAARASGVNRGQYLKDGSLMGGNCLDSRDSPLVWDIP